MRVLQWALDHQAEDFIFFSTPHAEKTICGIGCWLEQTGHEIKSWSEAEELIRNYPDIVLFYSQTFEGEVRWTFPKEMLIETGEGVELVSTIFDGEKAFVERRPYSLPALQPIQTDFVVKIVSHDPPLEVWDERLSLAKELFQDEVLKKIVLARTSLLEFAGERSQVLMRLLQGIGNHYRIAVRRRAEPLFFSKTPEKLLHWSEGHLQTVAIAGTAHVKSEKELHLSESSKDQYEHQLVVESILESLKPFAEVVKDFPQDILKLPHIVHLRTRIEAEGVERSKLGDLVESLHPTPAISGYPSKKAAEWLTKLEPPRGQYAGVLGFVSKREVELAVTIRSGFISQQELQVTTGVGVVEESEVESEWNELDGKLMQVLEGAVQ